MPLILSIETSSKVCSVALHKDHLLLSSSEVLVEKSHSKVITILCDEITKNAGITLKEIDAIAVSEGPGSYTGLRIGVSTAKGLCYALEKPLIAVNTLLAMAYGVNQYNTGDWILCPMIDARRMEVYTALIDKDLNYIKETSAMILGDYSFKSELENNKICFFGDGAFKIKSVAGLKQNAIVLDTIYPSAKNVGFVACERFRQKMFEDVAYFEPYYLKDFVSTSKQIS